METTGQWQAKYPSGIGHDVSIPDIPVHELLRTAAEMHGEKTAISFYKKTFSYEELAKMADAFAAALQNNGVTKADRVAIMLPNCPQFVISYYGVLAAGGIVTQVNPMLMERELCHILTDSGAETLIVYDLLYPKAEAIQNETNVRQIITVSLTPGHTGKPEGANFSFDMFLAEAKGMPVPVPIDPHHDIAVLQYTGGTTGRSKGAMLSHRNLVANVYQSYEFFKNDIEIGEEKSLSVIPFFHVFGMTSCMNLSVLTANCMVLLPRFDLEEVLQTIKEEQPTIFPGVPTMYVALTSHPKAEEYGLGSIRICNSGSAPMPVELLKEFERKTGARILEGYGLSEASPCTHCNPNFGERKPGSVGMGFPKTAYKIVDVATGLDELASGELGELIIKGPQVMKGYWNMPEETAAALRDGWLFTGDLAKMDEDGYVYIVDRKKDLIIASGYNIYPRDVEEVLYEHPAVREAVVIGVPDPYRGETVKAILVCKEGISADPADIIEFCRKQMAAYKVPTEVEFRSELPKTNVGKILRRALREEAAKKL
ncbi:long-chain fatty acid--CoA ligase [Bacillus sp. FJAT-42376]|uniref:long-chain-fatty-acid--CoA ligase n=1 Tax=Bacillus sp. FJAT-42376 TaxID=2014076 RepID=UPI000F4E96D7|nr:long-chain fatty acid--CoA ligase [Bacillus sp. FJAT-42376]AZB44934.1 long-chain fatty acid--CoA ligase [Bacillus sp. FJAT-42376]